MRSAAPVARRSRGLRAADFSNLCWGCLVAQRRQLSIASPPTISRAIASRSFHHSRTNSAVSKGFLGTEADLNTRQYLERWQNKFGTPNKDVLDELGISPNSGSNPTDNSIRLSSPDDLRDLQRSDDDVDYQTLPYGDLDDILDEKVHSKFLFPGDLVELQFSQDRDPLVAVFIRQFGQQGQFYTAGGKWFHREVKQIQFVVPGYVKPALLESIKPFLPQGPVTDELMQTMQNLDVNAPREIAAPVLRRLMTFSEESDAAYRRHASILDRAHDRLAHATDLRFGSLKKITSTLLRMPDPTPATMYAVRKALLRQSMGFIVDGRSVRETGIFQITPKELKERIELAQSWIREFQDETARVLSGAHKADGSIESKGAANVRRFVQKARRLIDQSRTMRDYTNTGRIGISRKRRPILPDETAMQQVDSEAFSETDIVLLKFLEAWAITRIFLFSPRINALPPALLRAVGRYPVDEKLDNRLGQTFLQEIGVIHPHENRLKFDPILLLPTASHSRQLEVMYKEVTKTYAKRKEWRDKERDTMADLRKDWTGTPVYCVDSATAEEIDDGVSIERIPGTSECWVNVHIANPTAFLKKTDLLTKMAGHLTETIYMPERTYPMLPKWLCQEMLSLGPDRPCLTISMRLNERAEVLEEKIQPGIIREFVPITPKTLQWVVDKKAARAAEAEKDITVVVGGEVPPLPERKMTAARDLSPRHVRDLRLLHQLGLERQKRRTEAGGIFFNQNYPDVSVYNDYNRPGLGWSHPSHRHAKFIEGDPVIMLEATPTRSWFEPAGTGNDLMVREMMLLAGEISALWCKKRNIPIIYRGTVAHPDMMSMADYKEKVIQPSLDENGEPPVIVAFNYLPHAGSSVSSTKPLPHQVLGVPQYTKVTSPLRRFADMLVHWQIESALRKEAELGYSLDDARAAEVGDEWQAFKVDDLERMMERLTPRERLISKTKRGAQAFWLTQLFFRAFYYGEAQLPETMEIILYTKPDERHGRLSGIWQDYSFDLDMEFPQYHGLTDRAEIGDRWEVRIASVDCYHRRVKVVPVRLISREKIPPELEFLKK